MPHARFAQRSSPRPSGGRAPGGLASTSAAPSQTSRGRARLSAGGSGAARARRSPLRPASDGTEAAGAAIPRLTGTMFATEDVPSAIMALPSEALQLGLRRPPIEPAAKGDVTSTCRRASNAVDGHSTTEGAHHAPRRDHRVQIDPANVERLLHIRDAAVAVRQLMRTLQRPCVPLGLRAPPHDFRRAAPQRPRRPAKGASSRADHGLTAFDQPMPHPRPRVDELGPRSSPGAPRASSRGETC
jgi:hypothetical protein